MLLSITAVLLYSRFGPVIGATCLDFWEGKQAANPHIYSVTGRWKSIHRMDIFVCLGNADDVSSANEVCLTNL
jgi:hypothetical protein